MPGFPGFPNRTRHLGRPDVVGALEAGVRGYVLRAGARQKWFGSVRGATGGTLGLGAEVGGGPAMFPPGRGS